jgi:hypothetical protein
MSIFVELKIKNHQPIQKKNCKGQQKKHRGVGKSWSLHFLMAITSSCKLYTPNFMCINTFPIV